MDQKIFIIIFNIFTTIFINLYILYKFNNQPFNLQSLITFTTIYFSITIIILQSIPT